MQRVLFLFLLGIITFFSLIEYGFSGIDFGTSKSTNLTGTRGNTSGLTVGELYARRMSGEEIQSGSTHTQVTNPFSTGGVFGEKEQKPLFLELGSERRNTGGTSEPKPMTLFSPILQADENLLISMRNLAEPSNNFLLSLIRYGGEVIVLIVPIFLIILWLIGVIRHDNRYKRQSLILFYGITLSFAFYAIINFFLPQFRPSPQTVVTMLTPIIDHPLDNSFPSGHAIFGGAFLTGLLALAFPVSITMTFFLFLIITLLSRIIGGVHYPGDILAGLLLSIFSVRWFHRHVVSHTMFDRIFILPLLRLASWLKL